VYGGRLVTLGVFGSVGRGTPNPFSDVDVLLVAEDLPRGRLARVDEFVREDEAMSDALEAASREGYHTFLSPVIKFPEEVHRGSLLFLDMLEDLVILYDRDGFFESHLARFKERLDELGARRIRRGNFWYRDLKPDYTPGEVIEL